MWSPKGAQAVAIMLLLVTSIAGKKTLCSCPAGYVKETPESDRCYRLLIMDSGGNKIETDWRQAKELCEDHAEQPPGSYLFVPSSVGEEMVIKRLFEEKLVKLFDGDRDVWIGCTLVESSGGSLSEEGGDYYQRVCGEGGGSDGGLGEVSISSLECCNENEGLTFINWRADHIIDEKKFGVSANLWNPTEGSWSTGLEKGPVICEVPATKIDSNRYSREYVAKHEAKTGQLLENRCHAGAPLMTTRVESVIECAMRCTDDPGCNTYNFNRDPDSYWGRCDLMGNNAQDAKPEDGCQYFVPKN